MTSPTVTTKLSQIHLQVAERMGEPDSLFRVLREDRAGAESFARVFHRLSVRAGWWHDQNGNPIERNRGEMLALIHSEISEAMEGERKDCMDHHLPHRKMAEVELADALIRIFDYALACGYDVIGAAIEKAEYNVQRADHKPENRHAAGGKSF